MSKPTVTWTMRERRLELAGRAAIMGILNVTPDSFSDGGSFADAPTALAHARNMIAHGVDLIDVGGESTRPGALPVPEDEERRRTIPVVRGLHAEWHGPISIDTTKAAVAEAALEAGAEVVNDVSGFRADHRMPEVCRARRAGVVIMHMQGEPRTMQIDPYYHDVVAEVRAFFQERFKTLTAAGIEPDRICFDPGIGFGKTVAHNLALLANLDRLVVENRPLMVGLSRKSFLGHILAQGVPAPRAATVAANPALRDWPTVALTAATRAAGALVHRVHQVRENREALRMTEAILGDWNDCDCLPMQEG